MGVREWRATVVAVHMDIEVSEVMARSEMQMRLIH